MHVHERALNDAINYAQKGCAMQYWGMTLKNFPRGSSTFPLICWRGLLRHISIPRLSKIWKQRGVLAKKVSKNCPRLTQSQRSGVLVNVILHETTINAALLQQRYVTRDDFWRNILKSGNNHVTGRWLAFKICSISPERNVALIAAPCAMSHDIEVFNATMFALWGVKWNYWM